METLSNGHGISLLWRSDVRHGADWETHLTALGRQLPGMRGELGSAGFGLALGLTTEALDALERPAAFARLRAWLADERCRVGTIDDISGAGRLDDTRRLATLLGRLGPPGAHGSVVVRPDTRPTPEREAEAKTTMLDDLLHGVAHCTELERRGGVHIVLALAPSPFALLETAAETVRFIEDRLLATRSVQRLAGLAALSAPAARRALRRHVGVRHDVGHSALVFEEPLEALDAYAAAGIDVVGFEASSVLRLENVSEAALRQLARLDGSVRRRAVFERRGTLLVRHTDLDAAMETARYRLERRSTLDASLRVQPRTDGGAGVARLPPVAEPVSEWRVQIGVPVFVESAGLLSSTRERLADVLAHRRRIGADSYVEVDTDSRKLSFDELPPAVAAARELDWVHARLN